MLAVGIDRLRGRQNAVRAAGQVGVGQHGLAAGRLDRRDDFRVARRHGDAETGQTGLLPGAHDHWLAADVSQRLAGQTGRRHASGYHYQRFHGQHAP